MKLRIRRKVVIEAQVQELAAGAVAAQIGQAEYDRIKNEDPHPLFVELEVGKEGKSWGNLIINGVKKAMEKIWGAPRIEEVARKMGSTSIYVHHKATNERTDEPVGEMVKSWSENAGGKTIAKGIAWIKSSFSKVQEAIRTKELDGCSMEADLEIRVVPGSVIVDAVRALTGIALSSSRAGEITGFQGAGIVAAVQENVKLAEVLEKAGISAEDIEFIGDEPGGGGDDMEMSVGSVTAWLRNQGVTPDKVYSTEELLKVDAVKGAVDSEAEERLETQRQEKDGKIKELEDSNKAKDDDIKAKDEAIKTKDAALGPVLAKERRNDIETLVKESEVVKAATKEKAAYIAGHVQVPVDMDLKSEAGGTHIKAEIERVEKEIKDLGITFAPSTPAEPPVGGGDGGGAGGGGQGGGRPDVKSVREQFEAGVNPIKPNIGLPKR